AVEGLRRVDVEDGLYDAVVTSGEVVFNILQQSPNFATSSDCSLPLEGGGLGWGCLSSMQEETHNYGSREKKLTHIARNLRNNLTTAEYKFWQIIRKKQFAGNKFRRQHEVGNHYIADFICLKKRLIIELDGSQHASQVNYDNKRTAFLEQEGYR